MDRAVYQAADELFAADSAHGLTLALVVVHRGQVVYERCGVQPDAVFGSRGTVTADTTFVRWSMAGLAHASP